MADRRVDGRGKTSGLCFFFKSVYTVPMDNLVFNLNSVFNDVIRRMEDEGAFDRDAYYDFVTEIIEEKRELGEITDDDDIDEMMEVLKKRWPDAEGALQSGHGDDILDES